MATSLPNLKPIPWVPSFASQTQTANLSVNGAALTLILTITFNIIAGYWVLTIKRANGSLILDSIPLLTGDYPASNILGQYGYLQIGSLYMVSNSPTPTDDYPTGTDIGDGTWLFFWGDN